MSYSMSYSRERVKDNLFHNRPAAGMDFGQSASQRSARDCSARLQRVIAAPL